jgi:hypothetical protein
MRSTSVAHMLIIQPASTPLSLQSQRQIHALPYSLHSGSKVREKASSFRHHWACWVPFQGRSSVQTEQLSTPLGIRSPKFSANSVPAGIIWHAGPHTYTWPYSSLACLVHFGTHSVPCPFGVGVDGILSAAGTVNPRVSAVQLRRRPHGDGPHSMLISLATRAPHQISACQAGLCIIGACLVRNVRLDGLISVDSFRFIEFDRVFKLPVIWRHRIWLAC